MLGIVDMDVEESEEVYTALEYAAGAASESRESERHEWMSV